MERNGGAPETAALTPGQQEVQALKAKISKLEREKSILEKATALLASEEIDRTDRQTESALKREGASL